MPACAEAGAGAVGGEAGAADEAADPMGMGGSGGGGSPIMRKLDAKIAALKNKKLDVFAKLRDAMRMAAKVEFYKGSLRAMDEEIQQTRIEKKKKQLAIQSSHGEDLRALVVEMLEQAE